MAMVTPICSTISAFDATEAYTFYFTSNGGNQVTSNKIIITNNTTGATVYTNTVTSYAFSQTVPANTLTNGTYYAYSFITYDVNSNASSASTPVPFRCYSAPTLTFTNITSAQIITSASYTFNLTYAQSQGELLDSLIINLYTSGGTLFATSGTIYSSNTPPITFTQTFNGMSTNSNYYIIANGVTVEGTEFTSGNIPFSVSYEQPSVYSQLVLTNNCEEGYVNIKNNIIVANGSGYGYEFSTDSGGTTYLNLTADNSYVDWNEGFSIPSSFSTELWFRPATLGYICIQGDNANTDLSNIDLSGTLTYKLIRNIPSGETSVKDYLVVQGYVSGTQELYQYSNYISPLNQLSDVRVFFKKVGTTYTTQIACDDIVQSSITWGDSTTAEASNIEFGLLTNMFWDETYESGTNTAVANSIEAIFPMDNMALFNEMFYGMYVSMDSAIEMTNTIPVTSGDTILTCAFNNSINAGTINILLENIKSIKIKRRQTGTTTTYPWITIYEKTISTVEDIENISLTDSFCPSGYTFEYAFVPVLTTNAEGEYVTQSIETYFDGVFVCDNSSDTDDTTQTIYKLYNGVTYGTTNSVADIGTLQPIDSRYPVVITNGATNYFKGSVTGQLYGYNFMSTRDIDRIDVVKETNDFDAFMKNGNAKIIKDWNGNIWLAKLASSDDISYNSSYGNGVTTVTFSWIEQGKYNNQSDLYRNGLLSIVG